MKLKIGINYINFQKIARKKRLPLMLCLGMIFMMLISVLIIGKNTLSGTVTKL